MVDRTAADIVSMTASCSARTYNRLPVVIERGEGVWLYTKEGRRLLDCFAMFAVVNFGHANPRISRALYTQAEKISVVSPFLHNETAAEFAWRLCRFTKARRMHSAIIGTEAFEKSVKILRKRGYMALRKWGDRAKVTENSAQIIVCRGNFHGRTYASLSASTNPRYRQNFGPFVPGFVAIPFGDAEALERAITPQTVGFVLEPIQGEGGIHVPPSGYLRQVRQICDSAKIALVFDEIQSGMGRTGKNFASDHEGVKPNLRLVGKALGGGALPIAAVVGDEELVGLIEPKDDGSTFAFYPLGCAVAIEAMNILEEGEVTANAARVGEYFMRHVRELSHPLIKEVRGLGLFIGIEFAEGVSSSRLQEMLLEEGMIWCMAGEHVLRFTPPLIITESETDMAVEGLKNVLARL